MLRRTLLGLVTALLALISSAHATPTASFRLEVGHDDGTGNFTREVSPTLLPNHDYLLALYGTVHDPNFTTTATDRAAATRNEPLGFQTVAMCINSSVAGVIHPVADATPSVPPAWDRTTLNNYAPNTALGATSLSVLDPMNLLDENGNGEVDVAGAGFANTILNAANAAQLQNVQVGAGQESLILIGRYHTGFVGATDLSTFFLPLGNTVTALSVFAESGNPGNGLDAVTINPNDITNTSLHVIIVPEPASIGLASAVMIGFLKARRRRPAFVHATLPAAILISLATFAQATPTVSCRLAVGHDDGAGNFAPTSPNALLPNQNYLVALYATVHDPNFTTTGTDRPAALRNQPLGMSILLCNLVSSTAGVFAPVPDPTPRVPPLWDQATLLNYPGQIGTFQLRSDTTLVDKNGNGEPDVGSAGFIGTLQSLVLPSQLPNDQIGANGEALLLVGLYHSGLAGSTILSTEFLPHGNLDTLLWIFLDPPETGSALGQIELGPESVTNAALPITIIPEPAMVGPVASALLSAIGVRRRFL
ncbi:MAG TPA: PEP-CTERM sorting domain-containing protein [Tepidisphaeraceae bacterium]|jgi:hypothetical protein